MPLDPIFTSNWKPKPSRRTYRAPKTERLKSFEPEESVEMQIGRSDFLLGELQRSNPFPKTHETASDRSEWTRGWLAEKQAEVQNQAVNAALNPPWKRKMPKAA